MPEFEDYSEWIQIWTDGSCRPGGFGAWGYLFVNGETVEKQKVQGVESTTINAMELQAILEALKTLPKNSKAVIRTDSEYAILCITRWTRSWKQNSWQTIQGTPVKNKNLLVELDEQQQNHTLKFFHVKGHSGEQFNEMIDDLVQTETKNMVKNDIDKNPHKYYVTQQGQYRLHNTHNSYYQTTQQTPAYNALNQSQQNSQPGAQQPSKEQRRQFFVDRAKQNGTYKVKTRSYSNEKKQAQKPKPAFQNPVHKNTNPFPQVKKSVSSPYSII